MPPDLTKAHSRFTDWAAPPGATAEDRRRRTYVCLCIAVIVPILIVFGLEDLRLGGRFEGLAVLALACFLAVTPFVMRRLQNATPLFRLGAGMTILFQSYELQIGGGDGYAFLWFYCLPILLLTLFGRREGARWALVSLASATLVLLTPLGYPYELETALRYLICYAVVGLLSYGMESSRDRSYTQLLAEKVALEDALSQVQTLHGLLPICPRCKNVRDDQGYWQQIELYVSRHSDAEFSHGVCPDCRDRLYQSGIIPIDDRSPRPQAS
ncbi:MAG: hypothetical protein AAF657_07465 [Acidobacteriota bacterium]